MNKKVTIYDVSEAAGVSACCVSWVLRNHPRSREVSEKTRLRILEAAEKIGYQHNQLASAMRTGKVNTIALLLNFNQIQSLAPVNQIISGIMMETAERRYSVKIFADNELELSLRLIAENQIDKIITLGIQHDKREKIAEFAEKHSMSLAFGYEHGHRNFPAVNINNVDITAKMVHHMAENGHKKIALLCVPHHHYYVEDRHKGYLQGMKECGLTIDPDWVRCSDDIEESVNFMLDLDEERRPTAFIALDDPCAARAQRAAWKRGLRIPEEFSVSGIGDTEGARSALVPVTTVRGAFAEIGQMLVRIVLGDKMDGVPDEFNVFHAYSNIIARKSVYNLNHEGGKV